MKKQKFEYGTLYLGNAKKLIKEIADNSVDLILTDPPYSLGYGKYDNSEDFYSLENELWRVAKPGSWLVFYWTIKKLYEPFLHLKKFQFVWQIICQFPSTYSKSVLGDRKYVPVLVFKKGDAKIKRRASDFTYAFELPCVIEKIKNALFKPTVSNMQLLELFSVPGNTVLDPFSGFSSIPLVCELFHRKWIAFEIDPQCYNIGTSFIKNKTVTEIKLKKGSTDQLNLL